jgi:hypothetical protein
MQLVVWIWMDEKYKYIVCTSYVQYVACNEMFYAIKPKIIACNWN